MRIVVFLDLDDTIFQTRPKCPAGEFVRPVAYHRDGAPLSFMTERQRTLLDGLFQTACVVPTTARNLDAFRRVELCFGHLAILDFGGVVLLPDGTPDAAWDAEVRPKALALSAELHALQGAIERFAEERRSGTYARVISDFGMPLYVVVKHREGDGSKLRPLERDLRTSIDSERFFLHCNDNNLSVVPRFLGKERAVQYVLRAHFGAEPVLTIGMGDSLTDAPFLSLCDYAMTPRGCQLSRRRPFSPEAP